MGKIYVDNAISSLSELHSYLSLSPRLNIFNKIVSRLGFQRFVFHFNSGRLSSETIFLVSGSPEYFQLMVARYHSFRIIFIYDLHHSKHKLPPSSLPLRRIKHSQLGGATSFVGLVGAHNFTIPPMTSDIIRVIKHYFNFSVKPTHSPNETHRYYTLDMRLNVHFLQQQVKFETLYFKGKEGARLITPDEIGLMLGLSEQLSQNTSYEMYPFPPVQIMSSILQSILKPSAKPRMADKMLQVETPIQPTQTYLPALQKFLPLPWSKVDYRVDKAAKSDDAEPVFRHWTDRITLVFPHCSLILPSFKRLLMTRLYVKLYNEFLSYLNSKFGLNWKVLLCEG